jgi:hypothetical protein
MPWYSTQTETGMRAKHLKLSDLVRSTFTDLVKDDVATLYSFLQFSN